MNTPASDTAFVDAPTRTQHTPYTHTHTILRFRDRETERQRDRERARADTSQLKSATEEGCRREMTEYSANICSLMINRRIRCHDKPNDKVSKRLNLRSWSR